MSDLFGESSTATAERPAPPDYLIRDLVALGVSEEAARSYPVKQARAVLASMRKKAQATQFQSEMGEPKSLPARAGTKRTTSTPGKVPLVLLMADVEFWAKLLADPALTDDKLAFAVGQGVLDLPRERLLEIAREIQALGLAMLTENEINERLEPRRERERVASEGDGVRIPDRGWTGGTVPEEIPF